MAIAGAHFPESVGDLMGWLGRWLGGLLPGGKQRSPRGGSPLSDHRSREPRLDIARWADADRKPSAPEPGAKQEAGAPGPAERSKRTTNRVPADRSPIRARQVAAGGIARPERSARAQEDRAAARPDIRSASGESQDIEFGRLPVAFEDEPSVPSKSEQESLERKLDQVIAGLPSELEARSANLAMTTPAGTSEIVDVEGRQALGATRLGSNNPGDRSLDLVLGIDLGTSSMKIVARLPYQAGSPSYAIPVPGFARAEGHPYLWASRIWLDRDGKFSLLPRSDAAVFCAIKAGLMLSPESGKRSRTAGSTTPDDEELATAFIALHIRQARGWLAAKQPALVQRRRLEWSYNFGFPAASLDDSHLKSRYQRCIAAALSLIEGESELTVSGVRKAIAQSRANAEALLESAHATLQPEIAAAVAGFANSSLLDDGLYAMVDVGAGTLDCCTFNLFKTREGSARCPIFKARVESIGVEPWNLCADDPDLSNFFRWSLNTLQRHVIWQTKKFRDPNSERWAEGLPLFFVGGGIGSSVHQAAVISLNGWLRKQSQGSNGVRIVRLPAPESLNHDLCGSDEVHRLAVAVGLSLPAPEIPEVTLPKAIEDIEADRVLALDDRYVGNELT